MILFGSVDFILRESTTLGNSPRTGLSGLGTPAHVDKSPLTGIPDGVVGCLGGTLGASDFTGAEGALG